MINYNNEPYPYFRNYIKEYIQMIQQVKPTSFLEEDAKYFWLRILTDKFVEYDHFEYSPYCQRNKFEKDPKFIKKILNKDLEFSHIDMFKNIYLSKKYDIVILSNMLEYIEDNTETLLVVKNNLKKILNEDGIVIGSLIVEEHDCDVFEAQKSIITSDTFEYMGHYSYYEPLLGKVNDAGYAYKLKKN